MSKSLFQNCELEEIVVSTVEPFRMLNRERIGLAGLSEKWFSNDEKRDFFF